jgi:hypothetical protein
MGGVMIRSEIIDQFRQQCPEIPSNVVTDVVLNGWCLTGDKEFCAETRCIVDQNGTAFNTAVNDIYYDLSSKITKFYDIDDFPGSGVLYNGKALTKTTMAELDVEDKNWRARDAGTPLKWYRRGKYLYLDRKIDTAGTNYMRVYAVLISDDWNANVMPFNQLAHLEPYHSSMVLYLIKKAKAKVGKREDAMAAQAEYLAYVAWAKKQIGGNISGPIFFRRKV